MVLAVPAEWDYASLDGTGWHSGTGWHCGTGPHRGSPANNKHRHDIRYLFFDVIDHKVIMMIFYYSIEPDVILF